MSVVTEPEIQQERIKICKSCEHFEPVLHRCKECNCLLEAKTRMAMSTCPLHKWLSTLKT
jgi:hypothetical protein